MGNTQIGQILLRAGVASKEQIKQALMRQRTHGGTLESHLLFFKHISEEQLIQGLEIYYGVPGVILSRIEIPEAVISMLPEKLVDKLVVCPFKYEPDSRTLYLAMLDPTDKKALEQVKRTAGVGTVKPFAAAENILRHKIKVHYYGESKAGPIDQIIELPDVFGGDSEVSSASDDFAPAVLLETKPEISNVLMITKAIFLKNFLGSIFERDGYHLEICSQPEQITAARQAGPIDHLLVSEDMEEPLEKWLHNKEIAPLPRVNRSSFTTVSRALLDNPAPYNRISNSLIRALLKMAEDRCGAKGWKPPYELICRDICDLSGSLGLSRLTVDGLQVSALLLLPIQKAPKNSSDQQIQLGKDFVVNINESIETANSLSFPWDIKACLSFFLQLISGKAAHLLAAKEENTEQFLAAQILTIIWLRHSLFSEHRGSAEDLMAKIKPGLREREGLLFSSETLECYLRLLEQRTNNTGAGKTVFVVSEINTLSRKLVSSLKQDGFSIVEIEDLPKAKHLFSSRRPDVIVVSHDSYADQIIEFGRFVKQESRVLLYAFTKTNNSSLIMNLLDAGFNDVFVPPYNYNICMARINKALAASATQDKDSSRQKGFGGTFKELPFVDLVQALGLSQRSTCLKLERMNGETAEVYLQDGQMVYATCGDIVGEKAIHKIISWQEDGRFAMAPVTEYPPANITQPNDFVLMEGCRLLDEVKV